MAAANTPATRMVTASVKFTSIPWKGSGRCYAPGYARTAASRRRSYLPTWASFNSSTIPASAAKPCSAPSLPPWSHDQTATTPQSRKSHMTDDRLPWLIRQAMRLRRGSRRPSAASSRISASCGTRAETFGGGRPGSSAKSSPTTSRSGSSAPSPGNDFIQLHWKPEVRVFTVDQFASADAAQRHLQACVVVADLPQRAERKADMCLG